MEQAGQDPNAEPGPPGPQAAGAPPDPNVERVRQRQEYYRDYDYRPYYYGHHYYFSDSDYHVFGDKSHVVRHERPESAAPSQPPGDNLDDALES